MQKKKKKFSNRGLELISGDKICTRHCTIFKIYHSFLFSLPSTLQTPETINFGTGS